MGSVAVRWLVGLVMIAALLPAHAATTLRAVRHITEPAATRLIVELSAPTRYRLQRVSGQPELGVPPRIYVDLADVSVSEALRVPVDVREGPLVRVRASQRDRTTVRLILDVPGLTEFGSFFMLDPFRLLIDVRGTPRSAPPGEPKRGSEPPAQTAALKMPAPAAPAAVPPTTRRRTKVVLDPGHGGKDPGAIGIGGVAEKDVTLSIARRLKDRLSRLPDIEVVLTRDRDVFLALEERTARANAEHADLFVSIHTNASENADVSGVETYYLNNTNDRATIRLAEMENGLRSMTGRSGSHRDVSLILSDLIQSYKIQESVALAETLQRDLIDTLGASGAGATDLGVKRGPFYVLVGAGMPCVLIEVSFLTHPKEGARLASSSHQDVIAEGLLRGIARFVETTRMAENL